MTAAHTSANNVGDGVGDLEAAKVAQLSSSSSTLKNAKRNLSYLINPDVSSGPDRRRTRALLRSFRYVAIFVFWRLVRYAKYAAVGAITAAVAGTAIGSVASGAAFIIAPTGIFAGAGVGLLWGLGKFGWRVLARRVRTGEAHDADPRRDEQVEHPQKDTIRPPRADPW